MKGRSLLALSALVLAFGCGVDQNPTGPASVTGKRSSIVSDGKHGGNVDFFFLPPLVKNPARDRDFELGQFNNDLQPSLIVEICELRPETRPRRKSGKDSDRDSDKDKRRADLPQEDTQCVSGDPKKRFGPGTVQLVNLPAPRSAIPKGFNPEEWWKGRNRPADGFYYVLWDTRQSNLNVHKYYRIKVLIEGSDIPLGFADVDPQSRGGKWQHSRSRDVIEMVDNVKLPIPFRVENGALCEDTSACGSATITNNTDPNAPDQIVQVVGPDGPVAGAAFPPNFLPTTGPQSIVVTVARVDLSAPGARCHPTTLLIQQFEACFRFETIPELAFIGESNNQFREFVRVAVCFELEGTLGAREEFVQLWASDGDEEPRALPPASDAFILTDPDARKCGDPNNFNFNNVQGVEGFASAALHTLQSSLGRVFGVRTAYAVDKGLGGLVKGFSNISPALTAEIEPVSATEQFIESGDTTTVTVRMVGVSHHDSEDAGLGSMPVQFTLGGATCEGEMLGSVGGSITVPTATTGLASARVAVSSGTCTVSASGQALNGPLSFAVTVDAPPIPFNEIWQVEEFGGWTGTWTRRGSTNVFDAVWLGPQEQQVTGVMTFSREGTSIHFQRTTSSNGNLCSYQGTIAADGLSAFGGEFCPNTDAVLPWTATIHYPSPEP